MLEVVKPKLGIIALTGESDGGSTERGDFSKRAERVLVSHGPGIVAHGNNRAHFVVVQEGRSRAGHNDERLIQARSIDIAALKSTTASVVVSNALPAGIDIEGLGRANSLLALAVQGVIHETRASTGSARGKQMVFGVITEGPNTIPSQALVAVVAVSHTSY